MRTLLFAIALVAQAASLAAPQPTLTEVEELRVRNAMLERVIVQRGIDDLQKKVAALKADLEKSHPGYTWDIDTGFTKVPEPKKPGGQ